MGIITLTSDYGIADYRVPMIKGMLLQDAPEPIVTDLSHDVLAFDLNHAAFILKAALRGFPKNSIHLIFVDSFYSSDAKYLMAQYDERWILCKDNGILGLIFPERHPDSLFEITINNRFDDQEFTTNMNILVPAALHLSRGGSPTVIGRETDVFQQMTAPKPSINDKNILGQISYIDHFGNLVTNVSKDVLENKIARFDEFKIHVRHHIFKTIYHRYSSIAEEKQDERSYHGKPIAYYNVMDYLEIGIYKGMSGNGAKELLGMKIGDIFTIDFN